MNTHIQSVDHCTFTGTLTVRIHSHPGVSLQWQVIYAESLPSVKRNPLDYPDDSGTVDVDSNGRGVFDSTIQHDRYKRGCRVSIYSLDGELVATKEMLV